MGCGPSKKKGKETPKTPPEEIAQTDEAAPNLAEDPPQSPEDKAMVQLKLIFSSIDTDSNGSVSKDELTAALQKNDKLEVLLKEAGLKPTTDALDANHDGRVTLEEFTEALKATAVAEVKADDTMAAAELPAEEKAMVELEKVFKSVDKDNNGFISKSELAEALKSESNLQELVADAGLNPGYAVLEQLDTSNDGKVSWEEFKAHLLGAAKKEVQDTGELAVVVQIEEEEAPPPKASPWGCC